MVTPQKTYDFKRGNSIVIAGVLIGGYDSDGGIEYEWSSDLYERHNGADGNTTVSRLNDDDCMVTVTVMESSVAYTQLCLVMEAQLNELPIIPRGFAHFDVVNGDQVVNGYVTFMNRPAPSKGRTVGTREFKILLANVGSNVNYGALNFL